MTPSQKKAVQAIRQEIIDRHGYGDTKEFKKFEVKELDWGGKISVCTSYGLINDEGTMASIFCRDERYLFVGPRGGIELANCKRKSKAKVTGLFDSINAIAGYGN